jgi:hypothetical protein
VRLREFESMTVLIAQHDRRQGVARSRRNPARSYRAMRGRLAVGDPGNLRETRDHLHAKWLVKSAAHLAGYRTYRTANADRSTNRHGSNSMQRRSRSPACNAYGSPETFRVPEAAALLWRRIPSARPGAEFVEPTGS